MYTRKISLILGIVVLFLAVNILTVTAASDIVLVQSIGQVEIRANQADSWRQVSSGTMLGFGDVIRTGPQSKAEIHFESGTIRIYENTILEIPSQVKQLPVSDETVKLKSVLLMKGRSLFQIFKNSLKGGFEVISPNLIAGVKGTTFRVASEEGLKGVTVFEGVVQVTNRQHPKEIVELTANHFTMLFDGHLMEAKEFQGENTPGVEKEPSDRHQTRHPDTTDETTHKTQNKDINTKIEDIDLNRDRNFESLQTRLEERITDLLEKNRELQTEAINGSTRIDTVRGTVDNLTGTVTSTLNGTTNTVTGTVDNLTGTVTGTLNGTTNTVTGTVDNLTGTVTGTLNGTTNTVTGTVSYVLPMLLP